jgi:hypothetical protein
VIAEKPKGKLCQQCGAAEATVTRFPPEQKPERVCAKCAGLDKFYLPLQKEIA